MSWISVVAKVHKFLVERGRKVDVEEVRKWFQILFPALENNIDEVLGMEEVQRLAESFPEGSWQSVVALSQTLLLLGAEEGTDVLKRRLGLLLAVWEANPVNYSSLLSELRKQVIAFGKPDDSIVEAVVSDPSKPSYFSSDVSERAVDFFLNYLKFEEGVDVDGLVEPLRKLLGKDDLVGEFLRLCDIDGMGKVEEFMERVEKGVDVLIKAKDQGLDLEDVLKRWDELANGGGERFVYLEKAVKEVADEEVSRKFWEAVEKAFEEEDIPVLSFKHHRDKKLLDALISLGLVEVEPEEIKLTDDLLEMLKGGVHVLKKVSPSTLYSLGDVVSLLNKFVLDAKTGQEAYKRIRILSELSPATLKLILSDERYITALKDLIAKTVMRGFDEGRFVSSVEEALKEGPTPANFTSLVIDNVHREEGA